MTKHGKILIIDDDPGIRQSLVAYLEDSGFETLVAETGRAGIEMCRQHNPELVLCDLRMPEMDGLDVLAVVTDERPETPLIVVSGMGLLSDAIQALKLGAWDYVVKPIEDMAVLEHAVRRALERAQLMRENREYREHLERINRQLQESLSRLREDEEAGRRLQFQLLPSNGLIFGDYCFTRELVTSSYVSGDIVDYFRIDDSHIGFYIADVSGHGVPSALVTMLVKGHFNRDLQDYWQNKEEDSILHPEQVLERLNRVLVKQELGKYLTVLYGVIDMVTHSLNYCNAGQFPFPILCHDNRATFLEQKGLPVGLFEKTEYTSTEQPLLPGTLVLLASDGILEALPASSLQEKKTSLLEAVNHATFSMEELTTRFDLKQRDKTLPDDVTLLMVRRGH